MWKFDRARALSDALANIDAAVVGPFGPLAPFGPDAFGHGLQVHHRHFFNEAGRTNTRIGPERVHTLLPMIRTQTGIQRTLVYVGASFVEKIKTLKYQFTLSTLEKFYKDLREEVNDAYLSMYRIRIKY